MKETKVDKHKIELTREDFAKKIYELQRENEYLLGKVEAYENCLKCLKGAK